MIQSYFKYLFVNSVCEIIKYRHLFTKWPVFGNTEIQYLPESTGIQYQLPKSNYIIKFTMICVNLDIYTVK